MHPFVFHDLETVDRRLLQLREDIGYLTVAEVLDRNHSETLGRVEFNEFGSATFMD
jgi:hypothetical protein